MCWVSISVYLFWAKTISRVGIKGQAKFSLPFSYFVLWKLSCYTCIQEGEQAMRIEQLEYFVDVAKTHSLNISAERLFVTQPTISEAIHKLEEELGSDLLLRSKKVLH